MKIKCFKKYHAFKCASFTPEKCLPRPRRLRAKRHIQKIFSAEPENRQGYSALNADKGQSVQTDNSHIGGKKGSKRARSSSLERAGARSDAPNENERSEFSKLSCPVRQYDSSTAQTIAGVKLQVNKRGVGGSMVQTAAQDFLVTSTVGHSRKVVAEARTAENYAQFFQRQMQIDATPLSRYYAAWLELCSPLPPCLDRTLSHGLSLAFRDLPPPFGGVKETVLRNKEGSLLLHQEIQGLLQKGVISLVPTALEREGCYSTYFLVPKKTGGHRAVLNLKHLNSFIREELTFKMLTTKSLLELIRPGDWATSLDLKDAFFHVPVLQSHRKYLRFHFKGQSYQYNVMPFGYTLAPLVFTRLLEKALVPLRREGNRIYAYIDDLLNLGGTPQEVRNITLRLAHHLIALGFSINWEKSAPDPTQRPVYLGVQLDTSLMKATLSEARRINLMHLLHRFRTIPGHSYHECQVMVGHLVSSTHLIPLGMLYARPIMRWFSRLRMHPRRDKGKHIVVPPRLHPHMNQWLYALGNGLSVPMGPPPAKLRNRVHGRVPGRVGGGLPNILSKRKMGSRRKKAHKPPGTQDGSARTKTLCVGSAGPACLDPIGQQNSGGPHQQTGGHTLCSTDGPVQGTVAMGTSASAISQSPPHQGGGEQRGGPPVKGGPEGGRLAAEPGPSTSAMGQVREAGGGPICIEREHTVQNMVLSDKRDIPLSGSGCTLGRTVASGATVCLSTSVSHSTITGESENGEEGPDSSGTRFSQGLVVPADEGHASVSPVGDTRCQGRIASGSRAGNSVLETQIRDHPSSGLAAEREKLLSQGLTPEVVNTIMGARAKSTNKQYDTRWMSFVKWCGDKADPFRCPIELVLEYLQFLDGHSLAYATIKCYATAITAFHVGFPGGVSVMTHSWTRKFLKGILRKRPAVRRSAPSWQLPKVLEALCQPPFEPIEQADLAWLSKKTAFLVAITSGKRSSDLSALSVQQGCCTLTGDRSKLILRPDPSFHPKMVRENRLVNSLELNAFYPAPKDAEEQRLHCLCPVRAVAEYLRRTEHFRQSDRLFIAYGQEAGTAITKQRLSHWLVDVISHAYSTSGEVLPTVKAHSTRAVATSVAVLRGAPLEEICQAADWKTPNVFISHYLVNTPGAMQAAVLGSAARS